jgi:hypothetical protein
MLESTDTHTKDPAGIRALVRREHPVDLRVERLDGGVEVPSVVGVDEGPRLVNVLLGHRPRSIWLGGWFKLRATPARQPADQPTEHQADLGRKGQIGGHADEDAERQPHYGTDRDGGSDGHVAQTIHYLLPQPGGFEG